MDYKKINKQFKKYKLKKENKTMEQHCKPKKFKLQPQQELLPKVFKKIRGALIYHKIGAGKTCTAVRIAEKFKHKLKITVVVPASLIGNFRDELRSKCADESYISDKNRKRLKKIKPDSEEFKKIIKKSNQKINKFYKIYSYHKFIMLCKINKIKLKNNLLIIDEIQNMISESGSFYNNLSKVIDSAEKVALLSATPMFDKPVEIALTLNLLKPKDKIPTGPEFNKLFLKKIQKSSGINYKAINLDKFKEKIRGLVSYYRGASPEAFPKDNIKIVRCKMSDFQYASYLTALSSKKSYLRGSFKNVDLLKLSNSFFMGPRIISNIAFPNKSIGMIGYSSLIDENLKNIKKYSIKFHKIYKKIKESKGLIFIYSNFKGIGGLKSLIKFLEFKGFLNYKVYGEGKNRYALWSGDERNEVKEEIKNVFNQEDNKNGKFLKIILGSPSIKEGVSLLRIEQVHILEPYWNISRMSQIIGRALRYCSHKDMPKSRRFVDIFIYIATHPKRKTIDRYIWKLANKKQELIENFQNSLKESAFDCKLFYQRNVLKGDKKIKCDN